jgi:hypothetical protein
MPTKPYQTMSPGRLAFVLLGLVVLLVLSAVAFSGALHDVVVPGWVGVLALIAYASLMFIL